MSAMIEAVSDETFVKDVLSSEIPVLVDFWAEWCGPCKAIGPILEEVANKYHGSVKIVKIDVDKNTQAPEKYGVRGIPTLILFKGGEAVANTVGALTKSQLVAFLKEHS